jgi:hypothetical protein
MAIVMFREVQKNRLLSAEATLRLCEGGEIQSAYLRGSSLGFHHLSFLLFDGPYSDGAHDVSRSSYAPPVREYQPSRWQSRLGTSQVAVVFVDDCRCVVCRPIDMVVANLFSRLPVDDVHFVLRTLDRLSPTDHSSKF